MNENLTQMVKQMETGGSPVFPVDNIDIPEEAPLLLQPQKLEKIDRQRLIWL